MKTRLGTLPLKVPQTRDNEFYPQSLERGLRSERALLLAIAEMYVQGVSTRRVKKIVEELAEKSDRSEAENEELTDKLAAVRNQLAMARLLGYGDQGDYKSLYLQLDDIQKKTKEGQFGTELFDKMKAAMSELWNSISG